ncbi:MAG TPA: SRPBCC family protein [Gammaproteobacteria bacterium]|nr:SRPBCC family protein [Gammaproteobacteria bacterium]
MHRLLTLVALGALAAVPMTAGSAASAAQPEYTTIKMEIDVAKPAKEVWAKVGGYCDISKWFNVDCKITSGSGDMGTVRVLAGGRVTEILAAKTDLAYGYTQPAVEGKFYNLYHGFLEVKPLTANTSKILYTLMYDISDKPDKAAKDADIAGRRTRFEAGLKAMKDLAEK